MSLASRSRMPLAVSRPARNRVAAKRSGGRDFADLMPLRHPEQAEAVEAGYEGLGGFPPAIQEAEATAPSRAPITVGQVEDICHEPPPLALRVGVRAEEMAWSVQGRLAVH